MATHSCILAWRIPWTERLAGYSPWGHKESHTTEQVTVTNYLLPFSLNFCILVWHVTKDFLPLVSLDVSVEIFNFNIW